jgi:hypothetical protein
VSGPFRAPVSPAVASPCISVCEMDAATGYCRGCFRTLDEIAGWIAFSDVEKRAVIASLRARRDLARSPGVQGGAPA